MNGEQGVGTRQEEALGEHGALVDCAVGLTSTAAPAIY